MGRQYEFDGNKFDFKRVRTSIWGVVRKVLLLFVASLSMAVLYYVIFSLFFSTEQERRLRNENRMYAREYPKLQQKEDMLSGVIDGLMVRDDNIYEEIFHASAPNMDPGASLDYLMSLDTIQDRDIVKRSEDRLAVLKTHASDVEDNFRAIISMLQEKDFTMPPMANPLSDFSFAQTGASIGERVNPFYKVKIMHNGLDLIAPSGCPVRAAGDGVVTEVVRSRKGLGNVVSITHKGGYVTRYAHLADMEVRKGNRVKKGKVIGYVGVSGNSFAPHLHYEIIRDTVTVDPVHHFFESVSPDEYVNMLIMSASTGQSLD